MTLSEARKREIIAAVRRPGSAVAFSAPGAVARHFKISEDDAKHVLQSIDSYTLHKEFKRPKQFNPFYVHRRRDQIQTDLIDIHHLKKDNNNVAFLAVLIDVFSRRAWCFALERKTGVAMRDGLKRWLDNLKGRKVKVLASDRGAEYLNRPVQRLLSERGIRHLPMAGSDTKTPYAERFNRTFQNMIYRYLSDSQSGHYLSVLPDLLKSYNTRKHRGHNHKLSPYEADKPKNATLVRQIQMEKWSKLKWQKKPKYKLGDVVRIKSAPSSKVDTSTRSYAQQYLGEYFVITRISKMMPTIRYYVRSMNTGEHIAEAFYANELSRCQSDVFKVERVLKMRRRRGRKEFLVRWQHFSPDFDSWVPESNIDEVYQ